MLATVQKQFFPNTEVVLVDLTSGEEAPMNDVMDLMVLAVPTGHQVEFITMLDEGAFEEFRTIISLLSYSRLQDGRYYTFFHFDDPCPYFAECNGQPQLLIEKLRKDLNTEGRDVIFSDTLQPEASVAVRAIDKEFCNPELDFDWMMTAQDTTSDFSDPNEPIMNRGELEALHLKYREMKSGINNIFSVIMALSELGQRNPAHLERLAKKVLQLTPDVVNQLMAFGEQLGAKIKPAS